jgi:D-apionolactonase
VDRRLAKAGDWTAVFESGGLRSIRWRGHEVLRAVYAAVRDRNWGTIEPEFEDIEVISEPGRWQARFSAIHRRKEIGFSWHGVITLDSQGVRFTFDGEAESDFLSNRIGFCVLHPSEASGQPCRSLHSDGSLKGGQFPRVVSPHQPFRDLAGFEHEVLPGLWAKLRFEGEVFEMEDQRNWTDASFKTYCTPLDRPFPVEVSQGKRVRQSVRLTLEGQAEARDAFGPAVLELGDLLGPRPQIGLEWSPGSDLPLAVDFLRTTSKQAGAARRFGLPLEIALVLPEGGESRALEEADWLPGDRVLLFHQASKCTPATWIEACRDCHPQAVVFGGTDHFFAELNRETPSLDHLDGLTFSMNPQVHAFDDQSLMETLIAQQAVLESAHLLAKGKPVSVSTVTLKMRANPNATDGRGLTLQDRFDPRLRHPFGAAWTMGSLKRMAEGGAASAAYFETGGPLGIADSPIVDVLRQFLSGSRATVRQVVSSDPYRVDAWGLESGGSLRLGIVNLTGEPQMFQLRGSESVLGPWEVRYV